MNRDRNIQISKEDHFACIWVCSLWSTHEPLLHVRHHQLKLICELWAFHHIVVVVLIFYLIQCFLHPGHLSNWYQIVRFRFLRRQFLYVIWKLFVLIKLVNLFVVPEITCQAYCCCHSLRVICGNFFVFKECESTLRACESRPRILLKGLHQRVDVPLVFEAYNLCFKCSNPVSLTKAVNLDVVLLIVNRKQRMSSELIIVIHLCWNHLQTY